MKSISLIHENQISLKQHQQLLVNLAMKQAFHVLQLPLLELSEWLKTEIESNPLLEIETAREFGLEDQFKKYDSVKYPSQQFIASKSKEHQENLFPAKTSLYEHLMKQASLSLEEPSDISLAELIIGHLTDKGFLETPLGDIAPLAPIEKMQKILQEIQSFDPPGIGARNVQDCLLLQLKFNEHANEMAIKMIESHYDDLLHNRLPRISQSLHLPFSQILQIIDKDIAPLDLYPGYRFFHQPTTPIIPDITLACIEGKWEVEVNSSFLPRFRTVPIYAEALNDSSLKTEESFYLRRQLASGKWLKRIVHKRNETLKHIGELLLKKQMDFFNGDKPGLEPLTIQESALELSLHESTIARAISNKFIACTQGIFPLKSFFSQPVPIQNGGKISKHNLRKMLLHTIQNEDKFQPLSDEAIAHRFRNLGIRCARRTITKYRHVLNISSTSKRKKW